jgi:hypothetical protein
MNINVIAKNGAGIQPIDKATRTYVSAAWKISEASAEKLVGGKLFVHDGQNNASYFGGEIIGWERIAANDRIVLKFIALPECKGVYARNQSLNNWSMELRFFE